MVSHRSGETEDTTIADLVVGLGTGQVLASHMLRRRRAHALQTLRTPHRRFAPSVPTHRESLLLGELTARARSDRLQQLVPTERCARPLAAQRRESGREPSLIRDRVRSRSARRAPQIKTGAPCRAERTAKYNQLMPPDAPGMAGAGRRAPARARGGGPAASGGA